MDEKSTVITWYPYPAKKPPLDRILISCKSGYIKLVKWSTHNDTFYRDRIDAWAELPKPYKKEETEC